MRFTLSVLCACGRGMRNVLTTALAICVIGLGFAIADNYTVTQGSGTTFASKVISAVNYAQHLICDATVGTTNCLAVNSSGQASVTEPNGANVVLGSLNDAATCAAGNTSIACLRQIDADIKAATQLAAGTNVVGFTSNDPCTQATKLGATINVTGSAQIITGTSAKKTYICAIDVVTATAQNIALVEGTGSVCATNIFGLAGGTTAATGWNFSANSGIGRGAGSGTVYSPSADTNGTAANICLLLSGSGQTSGQISYVQQ